MISHRERECTPIDVGAVVWCWVAPRCMRSGGSPICTLAACGGAFFLENLAAEIQNFTSAPDSRSRADVAGARSRRRWPKNLTGAGPGTRTRGGGGFVTDQPQNFFHSTHILSVFATKRRRSTFSVKTSRRVTLPVSTHYGNPVVPVSVEGHEVNACTLPATRSTKPHQPGGVFLGTS